MSIILYFRFFNGKLTRFLPGFHWLDLSAKGLHDASETRRWAFRSKRWKIIRYHCIWNNRYFDHEIKYICNHNAKLINSLFIDLWILDEIIQFHQFWGHSFNAFTLLLLSAICHSTEFQIFAPLQIFDLRYQTLFSVFWQCAMKPLNLIRRIRARYLKDHIKWAFFR